MEPAIVAARAVLKDAASGAGMDAVDEWFGQILAPDPTAENRTPVEALSDWVERLAQYAMTKHGLAEALRASTTPDPLYNETYDAIVGALSRLLVAAQGAGEIRQDLDPNDVILALAGLWEIDPRSDWRAKARQLFSIIFTGLRAQP